MDNSSILDSLLTDESENKSYIEKILVNILTTYLKIEKESGEFVFTPEFYELDNKKQIIVTLCGQLAKNYLGKSNEKGLSQGEMIQILTHIPSGTVKSILFDLRKKRLVDIVEQKNQIKLSHLSAIEKKLNEK